MKGSISRKLLMRNLQDCFIAFCPNNCTAWTDGIDSGFRGDCDVVREPPCCGIEPDCIRTSSSPSPCTGSLLLALIPRPPAHTHLPNNPLPLLSETTYVERATGFDTTPAHKASRRAVG
eukprot:747721-Hanusia_phi.AAC.3